MSILIKGIEMPKDCPFCPMAHWDKLDTFKGCEITPGKRFAVIEDKEYAESSTRPDWCPLTEVPEPHGDLIDRDALPTSRVEWEDIVNAPTIIPAEECE